MRTYGLRLLCFASNVSISDCHIQSLRRQVYRFDYRPKSQDHSDFRNLAERLHCSSTNLLCLILRLARHFLADDSELRSDRSRLQCVGCEKFRVGNWSLQRLSASNADWRMRITSLTEFPHCICAMEIVFTGTEQSSTTGRDTTIACISPI